MDVVGMMKKRILITEGYGPIIPITRKDAFGQHCSTGNVDTMVTSGRDVDPADNRPRLTTRPSMMSANTEGKHRIDRVYEGTLSNGAEVGSISYRSKFGRVQ